MRASLELAKARAAADVAKQKEETRRTEALERIAARLAPDGDFIRSYSLSFEAGPVLVRIPRGLTPEQLVEVRELFEIIIRQLDRYAAEKQEGETDEAN